MIRLNRSASRATRSASWRVDLVVAAVSERLREHRERTDRRLELVAHVGHEVAAHALDPPRLGDVTDEHDRADHDRPGEQRLRAEAQHLARRPEELQLALRGATFEGAAQQLLDRLLGERVGVPAVIEAFGRAVPQQHLTLFVGDHDGIGSGEQRLHETYALVLAGLTLESGEVLLGTPVGSRAPAQPNRPVM